MRNEKNIIKEVNEFAESIITNNIKAGVNVSNPMFLELFIQNLEMEYNEYVFKQNKLADDIAIEVGKVLKKYNVVKQKL